MCAEAIYSVKISGFYDEVSSDMERQFSFASQLGESYICPRRLNSTNICECTVKQFEDNIQPLCDKYGIGFSSIGSPFCKTDISDEIAFNKQCGQLKELSKVASIAGCNYIRVFSFFVNPKGDYESYLEQASKKLKIFTDIAASEGIILIHENEKKIYGDTPERCKALYDAVDSPFFRLCFDAANYVQCGVNPHEAYKALKPYTVYYHIKDCSSTGVEVPLGMGVTGYEEILRDLVGSGYKGFLTLEPHTNKYALLRKAIYVLSPVAALIKPIRYYNRNFKYIDKHKNLKFGDKVTAEEVFTWQYEELKRILDDIEQSKGGKL